jgi:hypothetical protein
MSGGRVVAGSNPVIPTVENQRVILKSQYGPFFIDKQIDKHDCFIGYFNSPLSISPLFYRMCNYFHFSLHEC